MTAPTRAPRDPAATGGTDGGRTGTPGPELATGSGVRLVAAREVMVRVRSKSFLWTTFALVAAVVVGGVLLDLASGSSSASTVGFTPEAAAVAPQLEVVGKSLDVTVETSEVDRTAGEQAVRDGDLDALVTAVDPTLEVTVDTTLDQALTGVFVALSQQLALAHEISELGGDPAAVAGTVGSAAPTVTALNPEPERDGAQVVAGMVSGILLFLSLMTAGQLVAQGVVEEKSSRVVELLLATLRPWQLMAGKVLGIGVIGLGQIVLVVGAAVGTAFATGLLEGTQLDLGTTALWAVVWFAVGYTTYALVLAALAALVSRQEDVGSVVSPVITLMVVPYIIGVSIAPWDPDNPLVVWLSYLPFCSPLLMPIRIALGTVEAWEVAVALGLSLALIPLLVWLAGRVYSNAILHSGGRVRLRQALGR